MVEKFEKGKKYKFSKERLFSRMLELELDLDGEMCKVWKSRGSWAQECDGKEVDVHHSYSGNIGFYMIAPEWCVEVGSDDDAYRISRGIHYALNYTIHNLNEEPNMVFMTRDIFTICQEQGSFEICEDINGNPQYEIFGYPIKVIDGEDEIYVGRVGGLII